MRLRVNVLLILGYPPGVLFSKFLLPTSQEWASDTLAWLFYLCCYRSGVPVACTPSSIGWPTLYNTLPACSPRSLCALNSYMSCLLTGFYSCSFAGMLLPHSFTWLMPTRLSRLNFESSQSFLSRGSGHIICPSCGPLTISIIICRTRIEAIYRYHPPTLSSSLGFGEFFLIACVQ